MIRALQNLRELTFDKESVLFLLYTFPPQEVFHCQPRVETLNIETG